MPHLREREKTVYTETSSGAGDIRAERASSNMALFVLSAIIIVAVIAFIGYLFANNNIDDTTPRTESNTIIIPEGQERVPPAGTDTDINITTPGGTTGDTGTTGNTGTGTTGTGTAPDTTRDTTTGNTND